VSQPASTTEVLIDEVIRAICRRPDLLEVKFEDNNQTVHVCIRAHPNDSKIIVGAGGSHLSAISTISRLLFHGSGKLIQFLPVVTIPGHAEMPYERMKPNKNWPQKEMMDFAERIAKGVFDGAEVEVKRVPQSPHASKFVITIWPNHKVSKSVIDKFASAMAILFVPIGSNVGHLIYATVKEG